jgi:hypothetical protein
MTTRIGNNNNNNSKIIGGSSALVPALGESWAHSANNRIILTWKNNYRTATISKSSYLPERTIFYKITDIGIDEMESAKEDREEDEDETTSADGGHSRLMDENFNNNNNQMKKRRIEEDYY